MQAVPPVGFELVVGVVGGGVEWVVGGAELVVVGAGAGAGVGVECVVVVGGGVEVVEVVVGIVVVAAVVWVVWCGFALGCGLTGFLAIVVVVGVVGVVAGFVVLVDDEAPQPAAIRASDTAVTHRMGSRLNCMID